MNLYERVDKIAALLNSMGGHIHTKKKLHKLIYLLQEANENFDQEYKYHNYGVFSRTLAYDLDYAEDNGVLEQIYDEEEGFTILLDQEVEIESSLRDFNKLAKSIINELIDESPQLLEVLSTIIYLERNGYSGKRLKEKLSELKPNLRRYYNRSYILARQFYKIEV